MFLKIQTSLERRSYKKAVLINTNTLPERQDEFQYSSKKKIELMNVHKPIKPIRNKTKKAHSREQTAVR